jgi:hypothetical protein
MATKNQINTTLSGASGTLNFVGSNSPTITTPIIAQIKDINGNTIQNFIANPSAINYIQMSNAATGNNPTIAAVGANSNIELDLRKQGTSGVQLQGRSTNTNPAAGYIGEFMNSSVAFGSAIALTTGTAVTLTSLNLTAGDWNTWGGVAFIAGASTSIQDLRGALSLTNNTLPGVLSTSTSQSIAGFSSLVAGAVTYSFPLQEGRFALASTTTVYVVVRATFSASTLSAYGFLSARRND